MSESSIQEHGSAVRGIVAGAAFTALTAVGAYIAIPIGPVPIVLQNFFVLLAGLLLGPLRGLASIAVYLLIGAIGLPVFAGGTGGIGHFFGPTGGYLVGFLPAVYIAGLLSGRGPRTHTARNLAALAAGACAVYLVGVPWLKAVTGMTWTSSLAAGLLPFIPGDVVKVIAAAFTAKNLSPRFDAFFRREE